MVGYGSTQALRIFIILSQVNILHIRALVKADAVILFDTYGSADSRLHSVFLYHLEVRSDLIIYDLLVSWIAIAQSEGKRHRNAIRVSVGLI